MTTPTVNEIIQTLMENADFEEVVSVAKAKSFISAAKRLQLIRPEEAEDQHKRLKFNGAQLSDMTKRAQEFVAVNDTSNGGSVRFLSAENFR